MCSSVLFYMVVDSGSGWTIWAIESSGAGGTHRAAALSTVAGRRICPDRATEREEEKEVFFCVCVCVQQCERILCGLMSGDGRVVRYEVSSAQFGCGSEHNESD